ncbi:hypothetical protein ACIQGW_05355 [Lysinibacillus xylanilyticus]|uniref:hypothetical protein n=1 Tax=Lysinibacillus xylanilyticus TaxID=582475 RepID=UPI0037F78ACB
MKLFHGTSYKRGLQILADKKIKGNDVDRVYKIDEMGLPTTDGYVYVGDIAIAAYYANKTSVVYDRDPYLMIFEVDVNDDKLEADIDEIKYTLGPSEGSTQGFKDIENPTPEECWSSCRALRVKDDLDLIPGKYKFAKLKSNHLFFEDEVGADLTMKIVALNADFSDIGEEKKLNLYKQIQWEQ